MKVRCRNNQNCTLSPQSGLYSADPNVTLDIDVGQEYIVYAVGSGQEDIYYYLCGENYTFFPHRYPSSLFDIIDGRPSSYWQCNVFVNPRSNTTEIMLALPEWATDSIAYYWNLTEHDEPAVQVWKKYKSLMEAEYKSS
jgi:hypothetical protein